MVTGETTVPTDQRRSARSVRVLRAGANLALVAFWLWLYRPVFDYLSIIFSREDFRTNQIVLVATLALIVLRIRKTPLCLRLDAAPQLYPPALTLALGGSGLYLLVERYLDINTLSATLFGLASYGLLGLWLAPERWRAGLPAALLLLGALPFGEHLQTFVGYPLRLFTARLVRDGLTGMGIAAPGVDTILVLENGVAQVDLPCSGVKSLWTGLLFLLAATWIERRPLNRHWVLTALIMAGLLFLANLIRVAGLVVVGSVLGWELLAQMLHVPLGVLGFVAACAAVVALLRRQPELPLSPARTFLARPGWLAPLLAALVAGLTLLYAPRPQTGLAQPPPTWRFPAELQTAPLPLTPDEVAWLTRGGAESADRRQFEWHSLSGSVLLITSTTWRAQHRPERCFEVKGLTVEHIQTCLIAPEFAVRCLTLSDGDGHALASAVYWFQSANRTTDDYGTRLWADLSPQRDRWVLVTLLFDGVQDPQAAEVQALYTAVRDAVATSLHELQ